MFNEAGAFLWDKMHNFIDEETLANMLQDHYKIDSELAKKDTKAFLTKMDNNELIDKIEE